MTNKPIEWATDAAEPDPMGVTVLGWRILVRPISTQEKTSGGILLPASALDIKDLTQTVGRVLALGPIAYRRADMIDYGPWVEVGDHVVFAKYGGQRLKYGGIKVIILNDDEVTAIVEDPDRLER